MSAAPRRSPGQEPIVKVLNALRSAQCDPVEIGAGKYESRCPCHRGTRRNLSVTVADDGTVLMYCFHVSEGGGKSCSNDAVLQAIGLKLADLFVPAEGRTPRRPRAQAKATATAAATKPAGRKPSSKKGGWESPKLAAEWLAKKEGATLAAADGGIYCDADERPVFAVYRLDYPAGHPKYPDGDKTYRPVFLDRDAGLWRFGDPDGLLPIFRLPMLVNSTDLHFHEGEKCARIAAALDLPGTTTAHGANSPQKSDLSVCAGKRVTIFPDRGAAGEGYASALLVLLARLAPEPLVRVVRLPGLAEDGDDLKEFVEARQRALTCPDSEKPAVIRAEVLAIADAVPWSRPSELLQPAEIAGPRLAEIREDGDDGAPVVERVQIEVNTDRHRVVDEAVKAIRNDPDLYWRGDALVGVTHEEEDEVTLTSKTKMSKAAGTPKVVRLSEAIIGCVVTRCAELFSWKTVKGEEYAVPVHPPDWLIKAVATRKYWPGVRRLKSVVECPFPRPDGTIVETPGYDAATSTLFLPTLVVPPLPDAPTQADARAAAARLQTYFSGFPFPTPDDAVVPLAGMLGVVARPAIDGPTPGIAVVGNKAGTGKALCTDVMVYPGTGRPAPTSNYPDNKEEAAKVKVSIVLSGKPIVSFDNLDEGSSYGGSAIDSALTALTIDDRILGASENTGELAVRCNWFLNGNNLTPSKDAHRRWLVCNLVTDLEHPEFRADVSDDELRKRLADNRPQMVWDCLVILKAHALAGRPGTGKPPLGSFGDWDRVVRGAVHFATGRDCLATQMKAADEAPERQAKLALLEGWRELPGGKGGQGGVTSIEAIQLVEGSPDKYHTLRAALLQRGRAGKLPDSGRLGSMLRALKNTPIGPYKLKETPFKRHNVTCWVVEESAQHDTTQTDDRPGGGGYGGGDSSHLTRGSTSHTDMMAHARDGKSYRDGPESGPPTPPTLNRDREEDL